MRHSHPILICCMLGVIMAACGKQEPDSLNLLSNAVNLPSEGGSEDVSIMTNQTWSASTDQDWLRVAPASGGASASYQPITLSAVENTSESARQATVTVKAGTVSKTINVTQAGTPRFTIADFKAKKADKVTWYKLSGEVASIANETYGNFYIFDETGYVYVYGLGEKKVESNDQSFSKLNLKVGDIVTMMTLRSEHNGVIEAGGTIPAYFVSKEDGSYKLGRKVSSTKAGWLELPSTSSADGQDLLIHSFPDGSRNYAAYWDYTNLVASWVAYPLCTGNIGTSGGRTDSFSLDPLLPRDKQPYIPSAFKSGNTTGSFDRGHQIPSADRLNWRVNLETFFGTNMTPQDNGFNGNTWGNLENKVRVWAKSSATDTLYVVTGCTGADVETKYVLDYDDKHIAIPAGYYKALLLLGKDKSYKAVGFYFDNVASNITSFKNYAISIDDLEKKVGVDFFVNLPDDVEKTVEAATPFDESWWWNN
ncbi:MAG: DNA/RNA non-specific endonuclease [Bacteroidales bacterium]|nr:DNA/RNA non-specific endonuclease [Bacteroidales bacterium]